MGKPDPHSKNNRLPSAKTKEKFLTDNYIREKKKREHFYNTTAYENRCKQDPSHDYLRNNLHIKFCVCGSREVSTFPNKKVSFRNYTPKILNQEINMGMWM